MMTTSTQQLDYAKRPTIFTRKRTRRIIAAVVVIALALAALLNRRTIDVYARQARLLYFQRRCANFSPPPGRVVYDDDPARSASLLAQPHYKRMPFAQGGGGAVVWNPQEFDELWFRTTGRPPATTAVLFMHERFTPAGERFILTCELDVNFSAAFPDILLIGISEIRPATWHRPLQRRNAIRRGLPQELGRAVAAGRHLRIYAGQADPNDRTHYTIRYEIDGVEGFLDGYEGDRTIDPAGVPTPGLRLELRKPK